MNNKKGWIRIIEAFMSILLIISVLVIAVDYKKSQISQIPNEIHNIQTFVLRTIQLNDSMRNDIINTNPPLYSTDASFPESIINTINDNIPSSMDCASAICWINDSCQTITGLEEITSDIYVQSVLISSTLTTYSPRQLKLFCWNK